MKKIFLVFAAAACLLCSCSEDNTSEKQTEISISVSGDGAIQAGPDGGEHAVTVTSSGDWRLAGVCDWAHPSTRSGKSGEAVTFTVDPSDVGESRSASYKFFCGDKIVPFVVNQQPANIFHILSSTELDVVATGAEITVKVESNVEFTYAVEEAATGWITAPATRAVETQNVVFRVKDNATYGPRTGKIIFTAGGKEYSVVVAQRQNSAIKTDKPTVELEPAGGKFDVALQANTPYTVEIDKGITWLRRVEADRTRALIDQTEHFEADAAVATRTAKITFRAVDGSAAPLVVTVNQSGPKKVTTDVPDANFRNYLGAGSNGFVIKPASGSLCEVTEKGLETTTINLGSSQRQIKSLEGIAALINVTSITCTNNPLETIPLGSLNVTSLSIDNQWAKDKCGVNVTISGTKVNSINLANNPKTVTIDVSGCPALTSLSVGGCDVLTTVYVKTGQTVAISGGSPTIEYK